MRHNIAGTGWYAVEASGTARQGFQLPLLWIRPLNCWKDFLCQKLLRGTCPAVVSLQTL